MRILHVHENAHFHGGVEQILFDTARGLSANGWEQALLYQNQDSDDNFKQAFDMTASDSSIIDEFDPDAVLVHKVSDAGLISSLTNKKPTAQMVHDHDIVCPRSHKYFPISHKVCTKPAGLSCYQHLCCVQRNRSDSILPITLKGTGDVRKQISAGEGLRRYLANSQFMKDELVMNGIDAERINVIHPVPSALISPAFQPIEDNREILYVGQVIRGKGVDLLLKALVHLTVDWHTTIVGDGNHMNECRQLAARLGIESRVTFAGRVPHEELESFYRAARVVVVPSRWPEPFGMVGIEAMARGRPVVAFDNGGISDWLKHESTGMLVTNGDLQSMAMAIGGFLDNRNMAEQFGRNGVARVEHFFSHASYLDRMKQEMEGIL